MLDQWTGDCSGSSLTVDFMSISSPDRLCTANFVALTP
jgi:hypothetical protein